MLGGAALDGADSRSAVQHQHLPVPGAPSETEEVPEVGPTEREGERLAYDVSVVFRAPD